MKLEGRLLSPQERSGLDRLQRDPHRKIQGSLYRVLYAARSEVSKGCDKIKFRNAHKAAQKRFKQRTPPLTCNNRYKFKSYR